MGTLLMRQASSFLQEKYKAARLAFTDLSEAALLVEKATDDNPWCPDTKTMTQIAEASYDFDDYWRIVDLLHKRLYEVNWKKWRQSYNTLILLEFLIIYGPEDFAMEFRCDAEFIKQLKAFHHIDNKGVNWGLYMRNKTERILKLVEGGAPLQDARSKVVKLTNEIQGFGSSSSSSSPSSSSSSSSSSSLSPSSQDSWRSSFDSYSPTSPTWNNETNTNEENQSYFHHEQKYSPKKSQVFQHNYYGDAATNILDWNSVQETFTEINLNDDSDDKHDKKKLGFFQGFCSKHLGYLPLSKDGKDKNT